MRWWSASARRSRWSDSAGRWESAGHRCTTTVGVSQEVLELMKLLDKQYLERPFFGSRRMAIWLRGQGYRINRKRVGRLMGAMGLRAIYRRPRTSKPGLGHRVYPYLLRSMRITRPNQVWAADITYVPMAIGFM